jgi:hypothetical protein
MGMDVGPRTPCIQGISWAPVLESLLPQQEMSPRLLAGLLPGCCKKKTSRESFPAESFDHDNSAAAVILSNLQKDFFSWQVEHQTFMLQLKRQSQAAKWLNPTLFFIILSTMIPSTLCFRANLAAISKNSRHKNICATSVRMSGMMHQFESLSKRMPQESRQLLVENVDPSTIIAEDLVRGRLLCIPCMDMRTCHLMASETCTPSQ